MCLDVLTLRLRTWNKDRLQNILASKSEDSGTMSTEGQSNEDLSPPEVLVFGLF